MGKIDNDVQQQKTEQRSKTESMNHIESGVRPIRARRDFEPRVPQVRPASLSTLRGGVVNASTLGKGGEKHLRVVILLFLQESFVKLATREERDIIYYLVFGGPWEEASSVEYSA